MVAPDTEFSIQPVGNVPKGTNPASPKDRGPYFFESSLVEAADGVVERSLSKIVQKSLSGQLTSGIGTGHLSRSPGHLMPSKLQEARRVRLFMKRRPDEVYYREQLNWHK